MASGGLRNHKTMHIPDQFSSKNGFQRKADRDNVISVGPIGKHIFNAQRTPTMEPTFWVGLINALGIPTVLLAIIANWGDWKSNLLFLVAFIFLCMRAYFYFRRQNQAIRREELEQEEMKRRMDDEIFS